MRDFLTISLGAIVGANARYFLSRFAAKCVGAGLSLRDACHQCPGSLIVGFFVIWTTERVLIDPRWRLLVVVGFCGSYTTFSSYAFETMAYFEQGQWLLMFTNFLSNNLLLPGGAGRNGAWRGCCKMAERNGSPSHDLPERSRPMASPAVARWKFLTICGRKMSMRRPHCMPSPDFLAGNRLKPAIWSMREASCP